MILTKYDTQVISPNGSMISILQKLLDELTLLVGYCEDNAKKKLNNL